MAYALGKRDGAEGDAMAAPGGLEKGVMGWYAGTGGSAGLDGVTAACGTHSTAREHAHARADGSCAPHVELAAELLGAGGGRGRSAGRGRRGRYSAGSLCSMAVRREAPSAAQRAGRGARAHV
jgi:hypothetical protein